MKYLMFDIIWYCKMVLSTPPSLLILLSILLSILTISQCQQKLDLSLLKLPKGFTIQIYAEVPHARQLVLSPSGTIFVSNRIVNGSVYAVKDIDGDYKADVVKIIASNLNMPNGVTLRDGDLYVAEVSRIIRFRNIQQNIDNPVYEVVIDTLPDKAWHGWKFIDFGPDGKLYFPIGAPCNICNEGDPYGTICRINKDGSGFEIYARGVRNSVGFDWDPVTGHLWFSENGRDEMGNDIPPDEINYAQTMGSHFGFPYCHGQDIPDPEFGNKDCNLYTKPKADLPAHVAALGVNFYTSDYFPAKYKNGMFIAQHGSWNRQQKIGYRVIFVKVEVDRVTDVQVFAEGWLQGNDTMGRPVDTEELDDGSLLISDDYNGLLYRVSYKQAADVGLIVFGTVVAGIAVIGGIGYLLWKRFIAKKALANKQKQLLAEQQNQEN